MEGRVVRLEVADPSHAEALFAAYATEKDARNWTYLPWGPFRSAREVAAAITSIQARDDWLCYAIVERAGEHPVGLASYLRIDPANGSIEVGGLSYSPLLQRTPASTEAMYLMMRRAFDELGYRRYEWKCNALNAPSVAAARRLGFTYEGTFRQAQVVKGRSRDTAWFSLLDSEWPRIKQALEAWLDPRNFRADGQQVRSLAQLMSER
jgi:RimJ/RimL family protein N-acetyltransferase